MSDPSEGTVVVGLMSGTSLDGVSAAVVRFRDRPGAGPSEHLPPVAFELLGFVQHAYTPERRARLGAALHGGVHPAEYCRLDFDLGHWLADAATAAIDESGVARSDVRLVASHGQTVWHDAPHSTWQFGQSAVIAERLGVDVVSDFRVRDVAAGGQGAPLVPIAESLLFSGDQWRALQNLGGIGNVTVVPPGGSHAAMRAFDTGPGCAVIDGVVRQLEPAMPYDVDGKLARAGSPIAEVIERRLAHPYFASPPPKSTGRELFDAAYIRSLIDECRAARPGATTADIVATATELTARSVGDSYRRFIAEPVTETLLSGGGSRNPTLVEAIARAVAPLVVRRFDEVFCDAEAKEAVAFALLGYLFLLRRPGNVVGATGARGPRVLGKLTPA